MLEMGKKKILGFELNNVVEFVMCELWTRLPSERFKFLPNHDSQVFLVYKIKISNWSLFCGLEFHPMNLSNK